MKRKGDTITLSRYDQLTVPTSGVLEEDTKIPIDTLSMSTSAITVSGYGRGVEYTSLVENLSKFDPESTIQKALKNQMKMTIDNAAAAAMKTTYSLASPTSATGITWSLAASASTAVSNINLTHCAVIRDYLRTTLIVPYYDDNNYIGIGSVQLMRGIKSDTDFMEWRKYIKPEAVLFRSEVGTVEEIRWIETNNTTQFAENAGTGSVLGKGIVFGDDFCVMVEIETPELRAAVPGDFGRQKAVAWYGELAFGLTWATTAAAGKSKGSYITSA